jgi:hypothetical protein
MGYFSCRPSGDVFSFAFDRIAVISFFSAITPMNQVAFDECTLFCG